MHAPVFPSLRVNLRVPFRLCLTDKLSFYVHDNPIPTRTPWLGKSYPKTFSVTEMLKWFRRRREAARLAPADADALVRKYGDDAHRMARHLEESALLALLADMAPFQDRTPRQWRRVARLIEQNTHHRQSLEAMARMANGLK
jgi:hypothetical protein